MGNESLFQASARHLSVAAYTAPLVVNADAFRFIVTEQLAASHIAP
jgi:mannose-1-phosphate guanylyltransferase/mannose-6-phosphate isomerase